MERTVVTTQQELDAALASSVRDIRINALSGQFTVQASGSTTVQASGSATVQASGSATVQAYDSATVQASGSATVQAYDSATVWAYDSATVQAYDSATVQAYDSATVWAYDSATVQASGSATVQAYDSATVWAYDSATVQAYDSATVRASGSATVQASGSTTVWAYNSTTVQASGSATVRASSHVAVHLHSADVSLTGGVLIDHTTLDLAAPTIWANYHGAQFMDDGATVLLYKAVNADLTAGHLYDMPTTYTVGTQVTATDWSDNHKCGGGLHISPRPDLAKRYRPDAETNTRYLRVAVKMADLRIIEDGSDKAKARTVRVLAEVDADGNDLPVGVEAQGTAR
jgi:hypothetical protein